MVTILHERMDIPKASGHFPAVIWHLVRYKFALGFIKETDHVLDCACGTGFGSRFMSDYCEKVTGIDIDPKAIARCEELYGGENREFKQMNALDINEKYDAIICYETLEHVSREDGIKLLTNYKSCLNKNGVMIISTPKKLPFNELSPNRIESHIYEYEYEEFNKLLCDFFPRPVIFSQTDEVITIGNKKAVWTYIGVCYNG